MVYNFNLGIGWASSGVEYAQSYRANLLRRAHIPARFVFTDMFPTENIEHMTRNIGFLDEEVIWLYTFFTDVRTSHVTFTLKELEATMAEEDYTFSREGKTCRYQFKESGRFYTCYMVDDTSDLVHRVEIVSNGCLIRKDFTPIAGPSASTMLRSTARLICTAGHFSMRMARCATRRS